MAKQKHLTTEALRERIRFVREIRELLCDKEAELILLYDAARDRDIPQREFAQTAFPQIARQFRMQRTGTR